MNYLATILVVVIVIILYYFYYFITNNELTSGLQELTKVISIPYNKLKNPNSYTYSYQCWFYIDKNTAPDTEQRIFYRSVNTQGVNPEFEVVLKGQELILKAGNGGKNPAIRIMTITSEFPIQKWTHLVINVSNLKTFEAYINGKLAKTVVIPDSTAIIPNSKTSSLTIGNGIFTNSYVTKFVRLEKNLDAKTVWENYLSGNGLSNLFNTLIPYGLNMSITKGEEIQRVINVI